MEPDDIDVVAVINELSGGGTPEQNDVIQRISKKDFQFPATCDSYIHRDYPTGHPMHTIGEMMRAYWMRQFGFSRSDKMTGIAVIRTPVS
jgi:hypothetical protein